MKQFQTGNHAFLRQQNLTGIMHYLYENAPISRVDLARLTNLNKTTVSSLIDELLENGFVHEVGRANARRLRPDRGDGTGEPGRRRDGEEVGLHLAHHGLIACERPQGMIPGEHLVIGFDGAVIAQPAAALRFASACPNAQALCFPAGSRRLGIL